MEMLGKKELEQALFLLEKRIKAEGGEPFEFVVCGGASLIVTRMVSRTTRDIDILSIKKGNTFIDPEPLPEYVIKAVGTVAAVLDLPDNWLNTGPADLFRMGLPEGLEQRLLSKEIGTHLKVHFISRLDQIFFKLYASVDRGGYHIEDLLALAPTEEELIEAGKWMQTHDVSHEFKKLLKDLLSELGYNNAASRI